MAYCRFENTANDLRDCLEHMEWTADLSETEQTARREIIAMAVEIATDYGYEVGRFVEDV